MTDERELAKVALRVVDVNPLGVMTTIDEHGYPHARWMTAVTNDNLRTLMTLTAAGTRKVEHLRRCDKVCWLFQEEGQSDVVLIKGRAEVTPGAVAAHEGWDRMAQVARQYAAGPLSDEAHLELLAILTRVETIELLSPRLGLFAPRAIAAG